MREMIPAERGRWVLALMVFGGLFIGQVALFVFYYNRVELTALLYPGWGLLIISLVLMMLMRRAFIAQGGAKEAGKDWLDTTRVVDTGIYGIIRHPLFLSFILLIVALMLLTRHWLSVVFGLPIVAFLYAEMHLEERNSIRKFGEDYERYMQQVPRINVVLGLIRLMRRRDGPQKNID